MNLPSIIPAPYRLLAQAVAIALLAGALVAFGWSLGSDHVQVKWDKTKLADAETKLTAEKEAREREQGLIAQLRKAENNANARDQAAKALAVSLGATDGRLQLALNTIRHSLPSDTAATCRAISDTALAVFGECATEAGSLAVKAGGHASDVQTLTEGWPKQ